MDRLRKILEWIVRHRYLSSAILLSLLGIAIGLRVMLTSYAGKMSEPIQRGSIVDAVYGIGTVTAYYRHSFNPLVGDTIETSFVREGDRVTKGEPIVKTGDGKFYYAPFNGVVNFMPYRAGENAYSTSPMMVVTDLSHVYTVVSIEQQGALRVQPGQKAKLSFDSIRQKTFEGTVAAVYSYANNFLARIDAVELPKTVLPDMTCDVAIMIGVHENALLIPVVAFDNGRVWVKRGKGLPHAVPVKLGVIDGTTAEVLDGDLQPGDRVMIRDQVGL